MVSQNAIEKQHVGEERGREYGRRHEKVVGGNSARC